MIVLRLGGAAMMRVGGRSAWLHLRGSTAAVMVRTAEPQARDCGALCGNRQHQQPDQQRLDKQAHLWTLPRRPPRRWQRRGCYRPERVVTWARDPKMAA